jgi:arabinofuranan 3-O-arabinosyltransferase
MSTTAPPAITDPAPPATDPAPRRVTQEAGRRIAVSVALTAAAFVQAPGLTAADTKIDLYVDPWGLLERALHLWDPETASGSLQNQAYGYLFPMGPFYALLTSAGIPPWIVQRLWWALILVVAFNGMLSLLKALGVGTPGMRVLGGIAYAVSPRIVSAIGQVSSEIWPMAMAPWVLLPLVRYGMQGGDPRRAAARSGAALLLVGAVNAVATIAVLVLPALYLLSRRWDRRTVRLAAWWVLSVVLASLWWVVALLLLGRYSAPFLDWIESSSVSTFPASVANSARGTTAWLAYFAGERGPAWPAGFSLVTVPVLILNTAVLAALGAAGLARKGLRERAFLVGGAAVGLVILSIGWVGPLDSPLAEPVRVFLDGAGSPLRNVHKFDPVLRIPLVVGLVYLVSTVRLRPLRQAPWVRSLVPVVAGVAVVSAAAPLLIGEVGNAPRYAEVPAYWREASDWLDDRADDGRVLVVPGSLPSQYLWGTTGDDILQPLLDASWSIRDGVPLGSAGNTRFLDEVERVLGTGRAVPGFREFLARAGVAYVVHRNDLDWAKLGTTRPVLVRAALTQAGLTPAASFGPRIGAGFDPDGVVDGGLGVDIPAVEVWSVSGAERVSRWAEPTVLAGGPEDLLTALGAGMNPDRAVVLAGDADAPPTVVTDGYRRREVNFGNSRANASATYTGTQPWQAPRRVHDYWPVPTPGRQSLAVDTFGVPTSSSSGAQALAVVQRGNAYGASQAFDDDARTSWRSGTPGAVGQWVELSGFPARSVDEVDILVERDGLLADVERVAVEVDGGRVEAEVDEQGRAVARLGGVTTSRLRVVVTSVREGTGAGGVGITTVSLDGLSSRRLMAPAAPLRAGDPFLAVVPRDRRDGCVQLEERSYCSDSLPVAGEERVLLARRLQVEQAGSWELDLSVRPLPGPALDRLLEPLGAATIASATSVLVPDPAVRPQSAVDRDQGTGWIASRVDPQPSLTLALPEPRTIEALRLVRDPALASSSATRVSVVFDDDVEVVANVDERGRVQIPLTTASTVRITALATDERTDLDARTGRTRELPWGVSEVVLVGADSLRRPVPGAVPSGVPCGFGPEVLVDGRVVPTRVVATVADLVAGRSVPALPCGPEGSRVTLGAGTTDLVVAATAEFAADTLRLDGAGTTTAGPDVPTGRAQVSQWADTQRAIEIDAVPGDTVLVVHENANSGWVATLDGRILEPVRIDGWQQGWLLPAGTAGSVAVSFVPDGTYRMGLLVGLVAALVLGWIATRRPRALDPAPRAARFPGWTTDLLAPLLGLLLAGLPGLVVGIVARLLLRRTRSAAASLVAGSLLLGAGIVSAALPWPGSDTGSLSAAGQALAIAGLLVVAASGSRPTRPSPAQA